MRISIEIDAETVGLLAALKPDGAGTRQNRATAAVLSLAIAAADGVRRPGAWERGWVQECFGHEWQTGMMPDPARPWNEKPRSKAATEGGAA